MCILQTVWPHIIGVYTCTVQQFLGPLVDTWWSLDGTRLENRIEAPLTIEDVRYKMHCWLAADVLTA